MVRTSGGREFQIAGPHTENVRPLKFELRSCPSNEEEPLLSITVNTSKSKRVTYEKWTVW